MWLMAFTFRMCHNMRLGGATRGKWRMPDGKDESGMFLSLELRRWYPPPVSIKDCVGWALRNKHRLCTGAYKIYGVSQT
jgi:hypothetical protein